MGWITDDGVHEGYLVPEFADGERGIGITGGGVAADRIIVETIWSSPPGDAEAHHRTRPSAEVIGWRVVCGCAGKSGPWASSELFTRAPTKALEDLPTKRVHADDAEVLDIPHRLEVDTTVRHLWRDQHLGAAYEELMELQNAAQAVESATSALSTAAQRARQAGATWEQIGNATGTTRQSAHERWS